MKAFAEPFLVKKYHLTDLNLTEHKIILRKEAKDEFHSKHISINIYYKATRLILLHFEYNSRMSDFALESALLSYTITMFLAK